MRSRYLITRILQAMLVVAITYLLTYWVLFALPGDPVANRLDNPRTRSRPGRRRRSSSTTTSISLPCCSSSSRLGACSRAISAIRWGPAAP